MDASEWCQARNKKKEKNEAVPGGFVALIAGKAKGVVVAASLSTPPLTLQITPWLLK